jgi:hypothetical protein
MRIVGLLLAFFTFEFAHASHTVEKNTGGDGNSSRPEIADSKIHDFVVEKLYQCDPNDDCVKGVTEIISKNPKFKNKTVIFKLTNFCPTCEDGPWVHEQLEQNGDFYEKQNEKPLDKQGKDESTITIAQMFWGGQDEENRKAYEAFVPAAYSKIFGRENDKYVYDAAKATVVQKAIMERYNESLFDGNPILKKACAKRIKEEDLPLGMLFDSAGKCRADRLQQNPERPKILKQYLKALTAKSK